MTGLLDFDGLHQGFLLFDGDFRQDDFEDAVQSAIAERIRADYIVTRNIRDFGKSAVPAVTPAEVLKSQGTPP